MNILIWIIAGIIALSGGFGARFFIDKQLAQAPAAVSVMPSVTEPVVNQQEVIPSAPATPATSSSAEIVIPVAPAAQPTPSPIAIDCGTTGISAALSININSASGTSSFVPSTPAPDGAQCFEAAFKACSPARIIAEGGPGLSIEYRSTSLVGGNCSVMAWFIQNPNPAFVGPEMVCLFNNRNSFQTEIEKTLDKCKGPLRDLLSK